MISTVCPAWTRPASRRPWSAVSAEIGTTAACSKLRLAGLWGELVLSCRCALSEGAPADAEDLVAGLEPGHSEPDRDHRAGHVPPQHRVLRTTKPQAHGPHQVGAGRLEDGKRRV